MHATQTTTTTAHAGVPARAAAALSEAVGQTSRPLSELLAERNALVDRANAGLCDTDEELDATVDAAQALEATLCRTPSTTADDVVAKIAVLAEFIRETGCPNREDVEAVLADAARVLLQACNPFNPDKIGGVDARWGMIPTRADRQSQQAQAAMATFAEWQPYSDRMAEELPLLRDIEQVIELRQKAEAAEDASARHELIDTLDAPLQRAIKTRAHTLNGLMGRAWLAELYLPNDPLDREDLEWTVMRALIDDVKAVYAAEPMPPAIIGSGAVNTRWIASVAAVKTGAVLKHDLLATE